MNRNATIAGLGTALPPSTAQSDLWDNYFAQHYTGARRTLAKRIFENSGVRTRQAAVSPLLEDVSDWTTEQRMRRYQVEAVPLGKEAVSRALADAGIGAGDLGLFAVCSCTGYATPGLDILLARDLGMSPSVQRLFVGHMGCYAALPGLGAVSDFVTSRGRPALLLCAELTSLHLQPPGVRADFQQIVSHALFSDAAAAVVVTPGGSGYVVQDVAAVTDTTTADHMTWEVTDLGFRMGLSARVPAVLELHVRKLVDDLLDRHGLTIGDIDGWAVHPGGPKILDVVQEQLGLDGGAMAPSREVLSAYGNCSSPTVLLVLDALRRRAADTVPPLRRDEEVGRDVRRVDEVLGRREPFRCERIVDRRGPRCLVDVSRRRIGVNDKPRCVVVARLREVHPAPPRRAGSRSTRSTPSGGTGRRRRRATRRCPLFLGRAHGARGAWHPRLLARGARSDDSGEVRSPHHPSERIDGWEAAHVRRGALGLDGVKERVSVGPNGDGVGGPRRLALR